jgi:hypothetical protein
MNGDVTGNYKKDARCIATQDLRRGSRAVRGFSATYTEVETASEVQTGPEMIVFRLTSVFENLLPCCDLSTATARRVVSTLHSTLARS